MKPRRSRKPLIITLVILVVIAGAGLAVYYSGIYKKITEPTQQQPQPQTATFEGTVVCLPHKNSDDPHTLECALGLQTDTDTYYGLSGATQSDLAGASGSDKKVKVTGELQEIASDKYKMAGMIVVKDFEFVK